MTAGLLVIRHDRHAGLPIPTVLSPMERRGGVFFAQVVETIGKSGTVPLHKDAC